MRKIIIVILLIVLLGILSSCGRQATRESNYGGLFVKITEYGSNATVLTRFLYDPLTKVVYIKVNNGLSPYYTIKFGEPVIALYGINWTERDLP